mmetsp:Transcript_6152/g.15214  ORF Transcript_6152/g.15214 Transcript_6152/m.15214 type:complete len:200 (-) Transcript_6152:84-683(-)
MPSFPLHHQVLVAEYVEPLGFDNELKDQPKRRDRGLKKREGLLMDDFERSFPIMDLPKLPNGCYRERRRPRSTKNSYNCENTADEESSAISVIDSILEVIDCDLDDFDISDDYEYESEIEDEVIIVPVKLDNNETTSSRSRLCRRGDARKRELLLDNASAITEALLAEMSNHEVPVTFSEDEESLDVGDIDDGYDSDIM